MRLVRIFALLGMSAAACVFALILCELAARWLNGQPFWTFNLPAATTAPQVRAKPLDASYGGGTLPADIDPTWIDAVPPPLPNRGSIDPDLQRRSRLPRAAGVRPFELLRVWNRRVAEGSMCEPNSFIAKLPPPLMVFDAADGSRQPPYRYLAGRTLPGGLVTNRFGWRGLEIPLDKPQRTIRLAFVGASTTVGLWANPFSYPEYVVYWLNLWAQRVGFDVRFDVINAGREGFTSAGIAAVITQELLPAEPDLILYYEGANQSLCTQKVAGVSGPPTGRATGAIDALLATTSEHLELARRLEELKHRLDAGRGSEPAKPTFDLRWWPEGIDEQHPDIARTDLPQPERYILADLDRVRPLVKSSGSELALSSFAWLVYDGLRLDPMRYPVIYNHLNEGCWPYRYADLRRALDLHNHLLEQYAAAHGLPFIDVASSFPNDPDLFYDAIHLNESGTKVHAWIVFRALLPLVRARIESGAWPRPDRIPLVEHPNIKPPYELSVRCPSSQLPTPAPVPTAAPRKDDGTF